MIVKPTILNKFLFIKKDFNDVYFNYGDKFTK